MIDFRYFLVTIAAVFLSIATGLVLGAGPLGDVEDSAERPTAAPAELRERLVGLQQRASYAERVAAAASAESLAGKLDGRRVALVALPGADGSTVRALADRLPSAGATVTRSLQVTDKWVDPRQRQFLDDLSADLITGQPAQRDRAAAAEPSEPAAGSAYDRAATVLAEAVFGRASGTRTGDSAGERSGDQPADQSAEPDHSTRILGAYDEGDLVRTGQDDGPAELAVVVAADPVEHEAHVQRSDGAPWSALARAFDRAGEGTVVAGPATAARGTGALAVVRSDAAISSEVSTVDVADAALGPAVVVAALAEQADGDSGHYGTVGPIDGAMPG